MPQISPFPGTGIDRNTGKLLSGWPHVTQSIGVLFTTYFGQRVMRRWFGSFVPQLLGEPMTPSTVLRFWTAISVAIDLWEPRFRITQIVPKGSSEEMRLGALGFEVRGVYMPRGHLGDKTPAQGDYTLSLLTGSGGVQLV